MSNHGYSRRRAKSKGDITAPTSRVGVDQVTGETVVVELDGVQLAYESIRRWYETAANLFHLTMPQRERIADMVCVMALASKRHTDADLDALRELLGAMNARG